MIDLTNIDRRQAVEDLEAIQEGLSQSLSGQGRPAQEFFAAFEEEHGPSHPGQTSSVRDDGSPINPVKVVEPKRASPD